MVHSHVGTYVIEGKTTPAGRLFEDELGYVSLGVEFYFLFFVISFLTKTIIICAGSCRNLHDFNTTIIGQLGQIDLHFICYTKKKKRIITV